MNFLAHIYLSGEDDKVKIGNFIGDHVKGRMFMMYPEKIRKGILMHRHIDTFTDHHPLVHKAKLIFAPKYGKYAGIIIDILYDHFLARNWSEFSEIPLEQYVQNFHELLLNNKEKLPLTIQDFLPKLITSKRILSYQRTEGIEAVFSTMSRYTSLPDHTAFAMKMFKEHYDYLDLNFHNFMHEIIEFVETNHEIRILTKV